MEARDQKKKLAVIRVRGKVNVRSEIEDTLQILHLRRVNWLTIIDDSPNMLGMVKKVKDYVTWGEIDEPTLRFLVEKWGRKTRNQRLTKEEADTFVTGFIQGKLTFKDAGIRPYFCLHPPSGGYDRGGVKKPYTIGGALGYRGEKINSLIARMSGLKDGSKK